MFQIHLILKISWLPNRVEKEENGNQKFKHNYYLIIVRKVTAPQLMRHHVGTHTLSLVDGVGPKGKVVTFEPQPWAYNGIKKTLAKNKIKNVKLINAGVSDKKGKIRFVRICGSSSVCKERRPSDKWTEVYDIPIMA